MMNERTKTLDDIRCLIDEFRRLKISTQEFCTLFEKIWNFEIEKKNLSNEVYESLDILFDEVTLFCSLPREQWEYPKYRDESEIRAAVAKVLPLVN